MSVLLVSDDLLDEPLTIAVIPGVEFLQLALLVPVGAADVLGVVHAVAQHLVLDGVLVFEVQVLVSSDAFLGAAPGEGALGPGRGCTHCLSFLDYSHLSQKLPNFHQVY